jgi:hypothetical protein
MQHLFFLGQQALAKPTSTFRKAFHAEAKNGSDQFPIRVNKITKTGENGSSQKGKHQFFDFYPQSLYFFFDFLQFFFHRKHSFVFIFDTLMLL